MCIRDSDYIWLKQTWKFGYNERQSQKSNNHHSQIPKDIRICLLYTSDAADDLLCVDLGGRRIIKNKNTTTDQTHLSTCHTQKPPNMLYTQPYL